MMTQLTYEGVIDEIMGIEGGFVQACMRSTPSTRSESWTQVNKSAATAVDDVVDSASQPAKRLPLFSTDALFAKIRDKNFGVVLNNFKSMAADIKVLRMFLIIISHRHFFHFLEEVGISA